MKLGSIIFLLMINVIALHAAPVWNTPTTVRQGCNINWYGDSVDTPDGNILYIWSDISSGSRDIYVQKFTHEGEPAWTQPIPIANEPGTQEHPQIIQTAPNLFVICWLDFSIYPAGTIRAQAINQDGTCLWNDTGVTICSNSSSKRNIQMLRKTNGSCYIFWNEVRNNDYGMYGQSLNDEGNALWNQNGILLASMNYYSQEKLLVSLENDEFIIGSNQSSTQNSAFFMKYDSNGNTMWQSPVQIQPDVYSVYLKTMLAYDENSFLCVCATYNGRDYTLTAQRYNSEGNPLWQSPPVISNISSSYSVKNVNCTKTSDNGVVITWLLGDESVGFNKIQAQKISQDGITLWGNYWINQPIDHYINDTYQMTPDLAGGVLITWQSYNYMSFDADNIYLIHLDAAGLNLNGNSPILVRQHPKSHTYFNTRLLNNSITVAWEEQRDGKQGIYTQLYDATGNPQLEENGHQMRCGIGGEIYYDYMQMVHRSNDSVIIWYDTRWQDGVALYYQIVDNNGNILLEPNGRQLTEANDDYPSQFSAVLGDNDQVAIVWRDRDAITWNYSIHGQLLDINGNKLWGEDGMLISGLESLSNTNPKISYDNDSYYVCWKKQINSQTELCIIKAQKIMNNIIQWDTNGITISNQAYPIYYWYTDDLFISNRYIVWLQYENDVHRIRVQYLNPDGIPSQGWTDYGKCPITISAAYSYEPIVVSNSLGLFITCKEFLYDDTCAMYAQYVSSFGNLVWGNSGIQIAADITCDSQILEEDGLLYLWTLENEFPAVIHSSKYYFNGTPQWLQAPIYQAEESLGISQIFGGEFENGSCLVGAVNSYDTSSTLNYVYISQNSHNIGSFEGMPFSLSSVFATTPTIATTAQDAYISWAEYGKHLNWEYGNYAFENDLSGIYLQRMNNGTVDVHDPIAVPSIATLSQNFPNPFNPETTIRYSLPAKAPISLEIYNLRGQKVKILLNEQQDAGNHAVTWNGRDDQDSSVASGVYFYRLTTGTKTITRKMVLVK